MQEIILDDKNEIQSFLKDNIFLHIYSLGDLDDFFWPYTTWYGLKSDGRLKAVILLYAGSGLPTVLALADNIEPMKALLNSTVHRLPPKFYTHLSPGLEEIFRREFQIESHGEHYKMALQNNSALQAIDCSKVKRLLPEDLDDIIRCYSLAYPDNWFDPRMLETGMYFGLEKENCLRSIAGVHVYSRQYNVAALGNIATDPDYRGRGLAKLVTAKLVQSLSDHIDYIGLNVKSDNHHAIRLYEKLGFKVIGTYYEYAVEPG